MVQTFTQYKDSVGPLHNDSPSPLRVSVCKDSLPHKRQINITQRDASSSYKLSTNSRLGRAIEEEMLQRGCNSTMNYHNTRHKSIDLMGKFKPRAGSSMKHQNDLESKV